MFFKKLKRYLLIPLIAILFVSLFTSCQKSIDLVDFFSINDFHGRVVENVSEYEPGVAKLTTFLKEQKRSDRAFVSLNAGDHFQDTYDSGSNRGNLLAKALPLMECEAMAIGNHEFDWGVERLKENRRLAGSTTFLGANIYHYNEETNEVLDFASEIAEPYKVITRNDHKIGLIGVIGEDQITSITSTMVEGYTFLNPIDVIPNIADKLRLEEDCDAVVLIAHCSFDQLGGSCVNKITSVSDKSNKRYVDAVFNGHTHRNEEFYENDVAFMQAGAHGNSVSKITLDLSGNTPKTVEHEILTVSPFDLKPDAKVEELVKLYLSDSFYEYKNKEIGTITNGRSLNRKVSGQMLAKITYEMLPESQKDVVMVFNNGGRDSIRLKEGGKITPGLIYDALPFTNKTYVAMIKGSDLISLLGNSKNKYYARYVPKEIKLDATKYYKIATIDYVLFHKDSNKKFDRLPSFTGEVLYTENRYSNTLIEDYFKKNPEISYDSISKGKEFDNILNF